MLLASWDFRMIGGVVQARHEATARNPCSAYLGEGSNPRKPQVAHIAHLAGARQPARCGRGSDANGRGMMQM